MLKVSYYLFSVKVFEVELQSATHTSIKTASQAPSSSQSKSCTDKDVDTPPLKKNPGRPKTSNREDDEVLFKNLKCNQEADGIERTTWQTSKWVEFEKGEFVVTYKLVDAFLAMWAISIFHNFT